jgi:hypothetical protein
VRERLNGRVVREGDNPEKLRIEFDRLSAEQNALYARRPVEADTLSRCKAWLAGLPSTTMFEQIIPDVEDGLSLPTVRARIKKLRNEVEALRRVPIPAHDVREKVEGYVQSLTLPNIGGIGEGEALTVQWPTGLHALMAFLQPDVLVERLMVGINQIANWPCPLAEREQQIAELEREIDRLQRAEEGIVVTTGAPREAGCPPWVVLGVNAVEAPGVRAA